MCSQQGFCMQAIFSADNPLILVGCGHMGRAMAQGWLQSGLQATALYVADPAASASMLPEVPAANFVKAPSDLPHSMTARAIILAVKPQIMNKVLPSVTGVVGPETLVVSVAAGVTLAQMEAGIDKPAQYVRAMPNTPAAVGAGITGVTAANMIVENQEIALSLMAATGSSVWIEDESLMDAVTGVSGSGPAYVFHMVEAMAAAGEAEGLDASTAAALARQTIIGAGQLMAHEAAVDAAELRERVTSPGGTTAAALDVLMQEGDGLKSLMRQAVRAATKRGKELAG